MKYDRTAQRGHCSPSHPTGVRGLKSVIEEMTQQTNRRTPLGCVD